MYRLRIPIPLQWNNTLIFTAPLICDETLNNAQKRTMKAGKYMICIAYCLELVGVARGRCHPYAHRLRVSRGFYLFVHTKSFIHTKYTPYMSNKHGIFGAYIACTFCSFRIFREYRRFEIKAPRLVHLKFA